MLSYPSKTPFNMSHLSESPCLKRNNKENSPSGCKYTPVLSQTSLDQEQMSSLSHKIVNEMLNTGSDYISEQLANLNTKVIHYQQTIKHKITTLLGESSQSLHKSIDTSNLQRQLSEHRAEEQNYVQFQLDLDRQQNLVYDYYEGEFNKLKQTYEEVNCEHQQFLSEKNKAQEVYGQLLETKAALQEDLNARLLQRAELVGQKEELEEWVEQVSYQNPQVFEIVQSQMRTVQKLEQTIKLISELNTNVQEQLELKQEKIKQLATYHQVTLLEVQVHQQNQKLKLQKNKIVPIQKSLNLPHPDSLFNEFYTSFQGAPIQLESSDFQTKLSNFIQGFRNSLFRQGNQGSNWGSMKEFVNQLEQFIVCALLQKQLQNQLNENKSIAKSNGDELQLQNEVCAIDFQTEVKRQQIKEVEVQRNILESKLQSIQEEFQQRITEMAQEAFDQYQRSNQESLREFKNEYGQQEYDLILQQTYEQLLELITSADNEYFNNAMKLMEKYYYQDITIQVNISMVDSQILPQLKQIASHLSKLKKEIERFNVNEKPHAEKLLKVEQEIQQLEGEFKTKISQFQSQEQEITQHIQQIKDRIESIQDQMLSQIKPNKALLEQEILQLNNVLTSLQEQKVQLESLQFSSNKSPKKVDTSVNRKCSNGILAISKSLNQFPRIRKQEIVQQSFSNQVVKGITPTKDASTLYLVNKGQSKVSSSSKSSQDNRVRQNFSLKSIK